jgi:hypothetical protein
MHVAAFSPWAGPKLIILAIALWPAATGAIIWVGVRVYLRSALFGSQTGAAVCEPEHVSLHNQ